jgi:transposase-like protein
VRKSYTKTQPVAKPEPAELGLIIEEVCRTKIGELMQAMLEAEVDEALERVRYERRSETQSKKAGYRDGHDRARSIASSRGPIDFRRPRVRGTSFSSALLPKHKRRLRDVDASLTELWLDGLATRDFEGTLRAFLGADAPLSATTISRVNKQLSGEFDAWKTRRLDDLDLIFTWADGVYLGAGPDDERRVFLAVMGGDRAGQKHLIALQEAMSESAGAWEELFADLKARGLRAPHLIVGDGAEGMWSAVTKAWPGAAQQRCWIHKIRNVEEKVPKDHQSAVRAALSDAMHAETAPLARAKIEKLAKSYERRYPKAAACIRADSERLLAYYRFPSATWIHLRTTNVIESIFAPIRHRTDAMKRLRTAEFANAVTYALIQKLSKTWRRLRGYRDLIDLPKALAK